MGLVVSVLGTEYGLAKVRELMLVPFHALGEGLWIASASRDLPLKGLLATDCLIFSVAVSLFTLILLPLCFAKLFSLLKLSTGASTGLKSVQVRAHACSANAPLNCNLCNSRDDIALYLSPTRSTLAAA